MLAQSHLREKAISLIRSGDCETARQLLLGVLQNDQTDQSAWIWYAETFPSQGQRMDVYKNALNRNPQMEQVRQAYQQLLTETKIIFNTKGVSRPLYRPAQPKSFDRPARQEASRPAEQPNKRISPPWVILALLAVLALLATTLHFSQQAQRLVRVTQELRVLKGQLAELTSQYTNLNKRAEDLSQQLLARNNEYQKLQEDYKKATDLYSALNSQYQKLQSDYRALNSTYTNLNSEHQALQNEYKALTDTYNNLSGEHQALQAKYDALNNSYDTLNRQLAELQAHYNAVNTELAALKNAAAVPPYVTIHNRHGSVMFKKTNGELVNWHIPFGSFENDVQRGYTSRNNVIALLFSPMLALDTPAGEHYQAVDFRPYVDPAAFAEKEIIPKLFDQYKGNDEAFIREVWNIVTQLAPYITDNGIETPRYPLETLLAGGGDCEETAILFASMIKAAPVSWKVQLVYMNSNFPNQLMKPNHVMVEVTTGSKTYLVETTSSKNMTPYPDGVAGWAYEVR